MTAHAKLPSQQNHSDDELAEVGSRFSADVLLDKGRGALEHLSGDGALAAFGFDAAWRGAVSVQLEVLSAAKSSRISAQSAARPSGLKADALHDSLDAWIHRYLAVAHNSPPAVAAAAPHLGHNDHRPARVGTAVKGFADFIEAHAKETAPFGGGADFAKQGHALAKEYEASRATHKGEVAKVGGEVRALHIAEGVVALELERLSKAAHSGVLTAERAKLYRVAKFRGHPHAVPSPTPAPTT